MTSFNERTAELKQVFSKTKLSSSVPDMEQIIETQEEMWQDIREDMESAHQAGVTLLDCIHPKQRDGADEWYTPDIKANAAELKEFLVKLKEMENDIEKLWKEQKAMIQYGLKVCLFEREINQVCLFG